MSDGDKNSGDDLKLEVETASASAPAPAANAKRPAGISVAAWRAIQAGQDASKKRKKLAPTGVKVHKRTVMVDGKLQPMPDSDQPAAVKAKAKAVKAVLVLLACVIGFSSVAAPAVAAGKLPVVYVYVGPRCGDCMLAETDIRRNVFRKIPVRFEFLDITRGRPADWTAGVHTTPAFRVGEGGELWSIRPYNFKVVGDTINQALQRRGSPRVPFIGTIQTPAEVITISQPDPVRVIEPEPDDIGERERLQPVEVNSSFEVNSMTDPGWSGVRLILLAGKDFPSVLELADGALSRLLTGLTDDKAALTIVSAKRSPKRYRAILAAVGVPDEAPLNLIVLANELIDPPLFKRIALKKFQGAVYQQAQAMQLPVPIWPLFERTARGAFDATVAALSVKEDRPAVASGVAAAVVKKVVGSDDSEDSDGDQSSALSWLIWGVGIIAGDGASRFVSFLNCFVAHESEPEDGG